MGRSHQKLLGWQILLSLFGLAPCLTMAQAFKFVPDITAGITHTDNATFATSALAKSDWLADTSLGIHFDYKGANAQGFLDYRLRDLKYREVSAQSSTQNSLNSFLSVEAIDGWLYLDTRANISQQNSSPFGPSGIPGITVNRANRVETATNQFAPYIRGKFSDVATYLMRLNATESRSSDAALPTTQTVVMSGQVKSAPSSSKLDWAIDSNILTIRNDVVHKKEDALVRASTIFGIDPQLHVSLFGGYEITDFGRNDRAGTATYGLGLHWAPSERTQFAAVANKRFFGSDHVVALGHRTALTAWNLTSSRDIALLPNLIAEANPGSVYSLMFDLLTSAEPDPVARAAAAKQRFESAGLPLGAAINTGFLTSRPFLNRKDEASLAVIGVRNTITLTASRNDQRAFGAADNLAQAVQFNDILQKSASASWAYKLSPFTTATAIASRLQTTGISTLPQQSTQNLQSLFLVSQIGAKTSLSFGFRRTKFESSVAAGYEEKAVVCSATVRF